MRTSAKAYSVVSALMGVAIAALVMVATTIGADQILRATRSNQCWVEASRIALAAADRYRRGETVADAIGVFSNGYGYHLDVAEATRAEATRLDVTVAWTLGAFPATGAECDQRLQLSAVRSTGRGS